MGCSQKITYGLKADDQIELPYSSISISSTCEYDDSGSRIAVIYDIGVSGVFTANVGNGETTLQDAILRVQRYLNTPRMRFQVLWTDAADNTETAYDFGPPGPNFEPADPDVAWGPQPLNVQISAITGGLAAAYSFTIRAKTHHLWLNGIKTQGLSNAPNVITSYTRVQNFGIDENGFTTRTISGKIAIASLRAGAHEGPDHFRYAITPPLPNGFRRVSQNFTVEADQLSATYEFVDREMANNLPEGMSMANATVTSRQDLEGGLAQYTLSGTFSAPKTVERAKLIEAAYSLATAVIPDNVRRKEGGYISAKELTIGLYDRNEIRFNWQWVDSSISPLHVALPVAAVAPLLASVPSVATATPISAYGTSGLSSYISDRPYGEYQPFTPSKDIFRQARTAQLAAPGQASPGTAKSVAPGTLAEVVDRLSAAAQRCTIIEFSQSRAYELKTGFRPFFPKVADQGPLLVQTQPAHQYIIDCGVVRFAATSADKGPRIPDPPPGKVLESSIQPSAPVPIGDGSVNMYRVQWRYVVLDTRKLEGGNKAFAGLWIDAPADPRRENSKPERLTQGPDSIVPRIEAKKP